MVTDADKIRRIQQSTLKTLLEQYTYVNEKDYNAYDFGAMFYNLTHLMHSIAKLKGWWKPPKTFGEQIVMMHSELSEAIEEYRKEHGIVGQIYYVDQPDGSKKPEGVPIELADLAIRLFDTCAANNINLLEAILVKAEYNLSRSHRHGNKKL